MDSNFEEVDYPTWVKRLCDLFVTCGFRQERDGDSFPARINIYDPDIDILECYIDEDYSGELDDSKFYIRKC